MGTVDSSRSFQGAEGRPKGGRLSRRSDHTCLVLGTAARRYSFEMTNTHWIKRLHRKPILIKAGIAAVAVIVLAVLLATAEKGSWLANACVYIAAFLLVGKELLSAFARDEELKEDSDDLEDWAALCSLFAVVAGVPALIAAIA